MRYAVRQVYDRFAVVYAHVSQGLVVAADCGTWEAARSEAARLEREWIARQRAAELAAAVRRERAEDPRRSVRYFEPDAFA